MKDEEEAAYRRSASAIFRSNSIRSLLLVLACFFLVLQALFTATYVHNGLGTPRFALPSFRTYSSYANQSSSLRRIHLQAPDDSIRATFMPLGATMIDLWVRDRNGDWTDVITGYDDGQKQASDPLHPYFGPQVGRYANRIKGGSFMMDGKRYHTPKNEKGTNTLHGGDGFDRRSYKIRHQTASSVTFSLHDKEDSEGFPGEIMANAEYILGNNGELKIRMDADVLKGRSPIMLSHHVYWALHGYKGQNDTILHHTLHLPKVDRYIETDSTLIPTGSIPIVKDSPFDFQSPRKFVDHFNRTEGVCGAGCTGWDSCFVMSDHHREDIILSMKSPETGIQMNVKTNQDAIQIYTCSGIHGEKGGIQRKKSHGGDGTSNKIYENHSCVVIEMEDYIDAINNPQWGRNHFYDATRPYQWRAEYSFTIV